MGTELMKPIRRLFSAGAGYSFMLLVLGITGITLVGGDAAIARSRRIDPRVCQEQFQRETEKCRTLTGRARAACQQQAANHFRTCRGQASPDDPGPALASVMSPGSPGESQGAAASNGRGRPAKAAKSASRARGR